MKNTFFLLLVLSIVQCGNGTKQKTSNSEKANVASAKQGGQPTEKDVMLIIMQNHDLPLSLSETCQGVGTGFEDKTMGQYLAGFWQYHNCETCNNSLSIKIEKGEIPGEDRTHWQINFMLYGEVESEPWGWGVRFSVLDQDWSVVQKSFQCVGAG